MRMIKYLRQEAGMGQGELAILIGTTQPAVADWENGKRAMKRERIKVAAAHLRRRTGWPIAVDELELDVITYLARRITASKPWGPQRS